MKVVLAGWAWLPKNELSPLQIEKIKRDLTLVPRKTHRLQTNLKPVHLYEERRDKFGVPREYFMERRRVEHEVGSKMSEGHPIDVVSNIEFRNDQEQAFGFVSNFFDSGGTGMILQAPPGFGKTVLCCALIAHFKVTTLVLVEREFLVQQWMDRLKTFLPGIRVGRIQGSKCQTEGYDVSIGMLQSLGKKNYPQEIYDWPGFLISDEVHRVSAPTWSPVVPLFSARRKLGLSVGPDSIIELRGDIFGKGWIGKIQDAFDRVLLAYGGASDDCVCTKNKNIESRGWDGKGFCWKYVKKWYRHNCTDEVREIVVSGNKLVATCDHSIFRVTSSSYEIDKKVKKEIAEMEMCKVGQLEEKDHLFIDDGQKWNDAIDEDLLDVVSVLMSTGRNLDKIHVVVDLTRDDVALYPPKVKYRYLNSKYGSRLPIKEYFRRRDELPEPKLIYTEGSNGVWVAPVVNLCDWAYMFGFWLGNGWIDGNQLCFSVKTKNVSSFVEHVSNLKWLKWHPVENERQGSSQVECSNSLVAEIFKYIWGEKTYCYKKWIPGEWVVGWGQASRRRLLEGLLASDGHYAERERNKRRYIFSTTSLFLVYGCQSLLRSLGVLAGYNEREKVSGGVIDGRKIDGKRKGYAVYWSAYALEGNSSGHYGVRKRFAHNRMLFLEGVVRQIVAVECPRYVYDLEMDGHPSFVANGILVHNSATPRRKDGLEKVFYYHLGPVKYKSKANSAKVLVKRVFTGFQISNKTSGAPKEIKLRIMLANKDRNKLIVEQLVDAVKSGRKVIVLSSTLKHLDILQEMFKSYNPIVSVDFFTGSWFTGEVDDEGKPKTKKRTQEELDEAAKATVILATYQMAQQALDIPALDTLFLTSPMSDVEQAVGRIEREYADKKDVCIVVDFVDDLVPEFEAAYLYRMKFYEERGLLKKARKQRS